jgi:hypothetical protein
VHVCPLDNAWKGELAIYCLEEILDASWCELNEDIKRRCDSVDYAHSNHQALLRKLIKTRKGAKQMAELWAERYEMSVSGEATGEAGSKD